MAESKVVLYVGGSVKMVEMIRYLITNYFPDLEYISITKAAEAELVFIRKESDLVCVIVDDYSERKDALTDFIKYLHSRKFKGRIISLTSYPTTMTAMMAAGSNQVLRKPFGLEEFKATIELAIHKGQQSPV